MKSNPTVIRFAPLLLVAALAAALAVLLSPQNNLDIEPILRSRSRAQAINDAQAAADVSALRWQAMGDHYGDAPAAADVSAQRWQAMGDSYTEQQSPSSDTQVSPAASSPQAKLAYHSSSVQPVDQRYSAMPEVPNTQSQSVSTAPQAKLAYHSSSVQPVDQRISVKPALPEG